MLTKEQIITVQTALIAQNFMPEPPTGVWDAATVHGYEGWGARHNMTLYTRRRQPENMAQVPKSLIDEGATARAAAPATALTPAQAQKAANDAAAIKKADEAVAAEEKLIADKATKDANDAEALEKANQAAAASAPSEPTPAAKPAPATPAKQTAPASKA